MVSNSISPLEAKPLESKRAPKKSKSEDDSFKNEMLQNEKRMKKKIIDGREATANANSQRSEKTPLKRDQLANGSSRSPKLPAAQSATVINENKMSQGVPPTATSAANNEIGLEMTAELQASAIDVGSLQKKEGKLSIEGMQLVQPQMMQTSTALPEMSVEGGAARTLTSETLLSTAPVGIEQKPSDLLSQDSSQDLSEFSAGSELSPMQNAMVKENATIQQAFAAVLDAKIQTPEQIRDNNVEDIISNARAILKDGGGEMKMQLRPEGLGTIDLKVGLQNGQVSVEIIAQDANVKKMFEDSVFDIRGALESQNLKIDTFKVGISEHFDQMTGQQNGAQQQFEEREFARDFMGQFRNERQGFRQQGIDSVLDNRTQLNSRPEGLSPAASVKNPNGRLNIIA